MRLWCCVRCSRGIQLSNTNSITLKNVSDEALREFLCTKIWNLSGISKLKLDHYYSLNNEKEYVATFCELLMKFKKLKYLELRKMFEYYLVGLMEKFEDTEFVKGIFNELKGFCLHTSEARETTFYNKLFII